MYQSFTSRQRNPRKPNQTSRQRNQTNRKVNRKAEILKWNQKNQPSRKEDWYWTMMRRMTIRAATPQGELPSEARWCVILLLSHGDDPKNHQSEASMEDNHRTRSKIATGVANKTQPNCCSAVSTTSSYEKYHEIPRKTKITARIRRTGYGKGLRVNPSKTEDPLLLS